MGQKKREPTVEYLIKIPPEVANVFITVAAVVQKTPENVMVDALCKYLAMLVEIEKPPQNREGFSDEI